MKARVKDIEPGTTLRDGGHLDLFEYEGMSDMIFRIFEFVKVEKYPTWYEVVDDEYESYWFHESWLEFIPEKKIVKATVKDIPVYTRATSLSTSDSFVSGMVDMIGKSFEFIEEEKCKDWFRSDECWYRFHKDWLEFRNFPEYLPNRWNGVVIFDRNNPNFKVTNTDEEISAFFEGENRVPVYIGEKIVGFVGNVEFWSGNLLIGDIFFWETPSGGVTLINYSVVLDKNGKIEAVALIELG